MNYLPHKKIGVAVIFNDKKQVLIDKRLSTGLMANMWEFPGGKWEEGETIQGCIIREIKEELNITIVVDNHLINITHNYDKFSVTLFVYACHIIEGKPQPLQCAEIRWVTPCELINFEFPPANKSIINLLEKMYEMS